MERHLRLYDLWARRIEKTKDDRSEGITDTPMLNFFSEKLLRKKLNKAELGEKI